jgi:hypothetical protein
METPHPSEKLPNETIEEMTARLQEMFGEFCNLQVQIADLNYNIAMLKTRIRMEQSRQFKAAH